MGSAAQLRGQMAVLELDVELVAIDAPSLARGGNGWWHADDELRYRGWSETRALIESLPPFDGVFGFSQGAVLASLVVGIVPMRFAIMVGGFPSRDPRHAEIYGDGYAVPSLHVIGRRDGVVPPDRSRLLAEKFIAPTIFEHDGGHVIPQTAPIEAFLTRFR